MKLFLIVAACILCSGKLSAQMVSMTDDQYRASLVKLWEEDEEVLIPSINSELVFNDMILEGPLILYSDGFILDDTILSFEALKKILISSRLNDQSGKHYWIAIVQHAGSRADEIIDLLVYLRSINVYYKVVR